MEPLVEVGEGAARRFFMEVAFDGSDYLGWQSQPHGRTVQQALERALTGLFGGVPVKAVGSGRTDAGTHALAMGVTFDAPPSPYIPDGKLETALNNLLPGSIKVAGVRLAPEGMHARFSARGKAYTYVINAGAETPFTRRYSWSLPGCADYAAMRLALIPLEGCHDFSAFAVKSADRPSRKRTLHRVDLDIFGRFVCVTLVGDGFLYKMARSITGAVARVGLGKIPPEQIGRILASGDVSQGERTAPAKGLFLMKVFYHAGEWESFRLEKPPFQE